MKTAMESLLRDAAHVIAIAGALEAMNDDEDRSVFPFSWLPMAMPEQLRFGVDLKQACFSGRDIEPPGHKCGNDGHGVAVFQQRVWLEFRQDGFHAQTLFHVLLIDKHRSMSV